jgi:hypothetical protein
MRSNTCPKCHGSMVEGFMLGEHQGMRAVASWAAGAPQERWYGLKLKTKPIKVQTWRCTRCGFLENYAHA